jgi:hypothetical protein
MKSILAACIVFSLMAGSALASESKLNDKALIGASVTRSYLDDGIRVNIGSIAVQGFWALADWQQANTHTRGQVLLRWRCDHWGASDDIRGKKFSAAKLVRDGVPRIGAIQLIADTLYLERSGIRYIAYAPAAAAC